MQAVILMGIQAAGKSTFYRQRFFDSHVRISLDLVKTRYRERRLLDFCLETHQRFVVDATNPTRDDRARYIAPARQANFEIVGYYFRAEVSACQERNQRREGAPRVPLRGLLGTYKKLELPRMDEGFDRLFYVAMENEGRFAIAEWQHEV